MLVVTYSCGPLQCYENELDAYKLNIKNTKATSFRQYKFIFDHEVSSSGLRNSFDVPSTETEFAKNLQNAVKWIHYYQKQWKMTLMPLERFQVHENVFKCLQ